MNILNDNVLFGFTMNFLNNDKLKGLSLARNTVTNQTERVT